MKTRRLVLSQWLYVPFFDGDQAELIRYVVKSNANFISRKTSVQVPCIHCHICSRALHWVSWGRSKHSYIVLPVQPAEFRILINYSGFLWNSRVIKWLLEFESHKSRICFLFVCFRFFVTFLFFLSLICPFSFIVFIFIGFVFALLFRYFSIKRFWFCIACWTGIKEQFCPV